VSVVCALAIPNLVSAFSHDLAALRLLQSLVIAPDGALACQGRPSVEALLAQAQARRSAETTPGDARAQYLVGLASMNACDVNTAIAAFKRALELGIDQYVGYQRLGAAYQMAQEPNLAVAAWNDSGDLRPALAWGRELLQPGKTELARVVFKAMTEMGDDAYYRPEGYYHLAVAWAIDGHWDLALLELEQAYQLRPDHPATLVDLARALYYTGGDRGRAEALIAQAVELEPQNEWMASILTGIYTAIGEQERAAHWAQQLEKLRSGSTPGR